MNREEDPHYIPNIVEPAYTFLVFGEDTTREVRSKIFEGNEAVGHWIPSSKLERIEFVDCGPAGYQRLARSTCIRDQYRHGRIGVREAVL